MKFFLTILVIVISGVLVWADTPESDIARLERENRELKEKLLQAERELAGYRQWLAGLALDQSQMELSDRERRALLVLEELARRGNVLSMKALSVRDECRRLLAELPLGPARKAQVELRLDELERSAMSFAALTIPGNSDIGSCRVLAADRELKVVVLSVGAGNGVFPGMVFHAKQNPNLKIRIIGTRFDGSVAEVVSGEIHEFTPGMEMSALHQDQQQRQHILNL